MIEVEVGSDLNLKTERGRVDRRHIETFWGRWILAPDPEKTRSTIPSPHGHGPAGAYYGVAQTRRGRIAVYREIDALELPFAELNDYDTLDDAQLPADIKRQVDAALGTREVIHRDI